MLEYLKRLFHLLLAPQAAWQGVEHAGTLPVATDRRGFYPWLAVTALSQFVAVAYGMPFVIALERAIMIAGGMYLSLHVARVALDMTLGRYVEGGVVNHARVALFTSYILGLDCLFRIIENVLPVQLTFLVFLPLLAVSVVFNAQRYLGVEQDSLLNYTVVATLAAIVLPLALTALLILFV